MPETYPTGGAKNFIHGIDYQKLWLMLFFRRAVNRKYFFRLATEMSSAAGFDDIVFRYEQNGTTVCMLIQVKHKQDGSKKICVGDLLTKSGELNLVKHFAAFLEIQGNEEFKDKIKDFFIVINVDFDYESLASKGITVEKIETQDEFLNIGDSAKYKLRDLRNNIAQYLKQRMSAEDREVSDEEIKGFLNELVFVVNLPSDVELEKLIRNEINDDLARRFKYFGDNDSVLNALSTMISNWMKDKRGRFLTPEEGEKFFREVEKLPSTLSEIKKSQDEIKCIVKRTEEKVDEIMKEMLKPLYKSSEILRKLYTAVTAQNNKQRLCKKPCTEVGLTTWKTTIAAIMQKKFGSEALSILEMMAYFAPYKIYVEEIFSKPITDDKEKLWSAIELLNRYSMIDLKKGVVNVHRLVQEAARLRLQKEGRKEEVLRKALELMNSGKITQCSIRHIASVWEYASKHGKLIDEFYFNSIYGRQKCTPLHSLAEGNNYEAVETLLTHIGERHIGRLDKVVNAKDEYGYTPLHLAAYEGKLGTVKCLISKGADVNTKNKYGVTALHMAAYYGRLNIVKYLVNKDADINTNAVELFLNGTSLHCAVYRGKQSIVKCLVDKGTYVDAKDEHDRTPLHCSALFGSSDAAEYLIQENANVNAKDKNGDTPLHLAAIVGRVDIAKILLKHNADVNTKNNEGKTALHYATDFDHRDLVELLLAHGASIL